MGAIHAAHALLPVGLARDVRVTVVGDRIAAVAENCRAEPGDERVALLLPGMMSLHSHAFQRGMAGLAEVRGAAADSFWTWREAMYRFALAITPDEMEAIAAWLHVEMLEAGFTRVGEFHYLHHAPDGRPYADIAEMAGRIVAAAAASGIGLTLLPSFYAHATFGGAPPLDGQRRFVTGLDGFTRLMEGCRGHVRHLARANAGVAPHSLRAVTPDELADVAALAAGGPIHIHAAEQTKEVADCLAWSGRRPVEWLLEHAGLGERWCVIHATHMTDAETAGLARCGAVAGLCPVTEASLGDGIFNGRRFLDAGGRLGIGTDSNILVGVTDELRQLEYAQRLKERARNVLAEGGGSTGTTLYAKAVQGGGAALGLDEPGIRAGSAADLVAPDVGGPTFAAVPPAQWLDAWIFASRAAVDRVWVGGRLLVAGGCHRDREAIGERFRQTMQALAARS